MQVLSGWFWGPHPSVAKLGSQSFHVKWSHQPPAFLGLSSAQVSAIVQHLGTPIDAIYIKPHPASLQKNALKDCISTVPSLDMETSCMEPTTYGPTIPFIRTGNRPLETCTWMWAHDTRRHIDALKTEAGDGHQSRSQWGFCWAIEMSIRKLFLPWPPRADRPACGTLSCDQRRDVVSNRTRRKPSRTEGLLKSLQSVYCT